MIYTRYHFVFAFLLGAQSTWAEKNVPFMNQVRSRLNVTSVENNMLRQRASNLTIPRPHSLYQYRQQVCLTTLDTSS